MHLTFNYWQVGLVVAIVMLPLTLARYRYKNIKSVVLFGIVSFTLRVLLWPLQIIESMLGIAGIEIKKEYKNDEEE